MISLDTHYEFLFNPDSHVLIRVQDCLELHKVKKFLEFLPIGTVVKGLERLCVDDFVEAPTIQARCHKAGIKLSQGGYYPSRDNWDTLQSGEVVQWERKSREYPGGTVFMLLGHVVFPWYPMRPARGGKLYDHEINLCVQIWQPMISSGEPFAGNIRLEDREILVKGTSGYKTTRNPFSKGVVMPGLSFEIVDRTFLDHQPEWIKREHHRLLNWNDNNNGK